MKFKCNFYKLNSKTGKHYEEFSCEIEEKNLESMRKRLEDNDFRILSNYDNLVMSRPVGEFDEEFVIVA